MTQLSLIDEPAPPQPEPTPAPPAKIHVGSGMQTYRRNVWNFAAQKNLAANPDLAQKVVLSFILSGKASHIKDYKLTPFYEKITEDKVDSSPCNRGDRLPHIFAVVDCLDKPAETKLITAMSLVLMPDVGESDVKTTLQYLGIELADYWKIDSEFLALLTKTEIVAIAKEYGVDRHMGSSFSRLSGGKKDEFIASIISSRFDFSGKIPGFMQFNND
jgi:ParB family transcriptional regulator, chromosome partitioning protein